jgi:conjugal transfer/entry exclusion protein
MEPHSPSALGRLQALQVSVQAVLQQTPSTQNPVRHSLSQVQASAVPFDFAPASDEQATLESAG